MSRSSGIQRIRRAVLPVCLAMAAATCVCAGRAAVADQLILRDEAGTLNGLTLGVDNSGVLFRVGHEQARTFTWDRVRTLTTDDAALQTAFDAHRDEAVTLWRARTRVERGDYHMAEPLLIPLFATTRGRTDAVAIIVAEGLLRCHVARGDPAAAVVPWLECLRLRSAGVTQTAFAAMSAILDDRTGLCIALPPIWTPGDPNAARAVSELTSYLDESDPGDPMVHRLAELYLSAARMALVDPAAAEPITEDTLLESLETLANGDARDAATFIQAMVMAVDSRSLDSQRAAAIRILSRMARDAGRFGQWARYAGGLAKVRQPAEDQQREGLVDLLSLPALVSAGVPDVDRHLAGLALEQAAQALTRKGRTEQAASLRAELVALYPDHPVHRRAADATQRLKMENGP